MTRARILRFSGEVFRSNGFPEELLQQLEGLYSARRVQPTLADLAQYDPVEKLDMDGWYNREVAARSAMPHRYSSARLYVQASLKHNLVRSARIAFDMYSAGNAAKTNPE